MGWTITLYICIFQLIKEIERIMTNAIRTRNIIAQPIFYLPFT